MRSLLALVGIVALILVACMYFGIINIDQTKQGVVQAPEFKADVAKVKLGTEEKTVKVPTIAVQKPGDNSAAQ